ncbi:testis-expressed protein 48 isoform X2 [Talpa occidentalis]|uniref:testis-expressed protein 48 isoform X2 n=1 Tax=Talpa occidentalis TaxID=50954 RepID=UPI0023F9F79B|nr:testis-expressed protein 48 isoform X2 [Talpa occidentalis]
MLRESRSGLCVQSWSTLPPSSPTLRHIHQRRQDVSSALEDSLTGSMASWIEGSTTREGFSKSPASFLPLPPTFPGSQLCDITDNLLSALPAAGEVGSYSRSADSTRPPAGKPGRLGLQLLPMAHKSLASKIFCLCCRDCKEPRDMDDSNTSSQTQEHQTLTGLQLQKNERGRQNPKLANTGKPIIYAEEDSFSSSYEFEQSMRRTCPSGPTIPRRQPKHGVKDPLLLLLQGQQWVIYDLFLLPRTESMSRASSTVFEFEQRFSHIFF